MNFVSIGSNNLRAVVLWLREKGLSDQTILDLVKFELRADLRKTREGAR